jgi:cell division protein FtsA
VLTGGSSKLQGMVELAEEVFHQPVRLGVPRYEGGLKEVVCNPIYSTGIGLIHFGNRRRNDPIASEKMKSGFSSVMKKMKSWFKGSF